MSVQTRRLDKVETSLSPRQAVLHWMMEAHELGSLHQYALSLKGKPDSAFPLVKLPKQVEQAVRDAMKGQNKDWVERSVQSAIKDVIFLFKLQFKANIDFMEEKQKLSMIHLWLFEKLQRLREAEWLSHDMTTAWWEVSRQLPYPLDVQTAGAVKAATENWVETWDLIDDVSMVSDWVTANFVAQGKTEVPFGSSYLHPGDYPVPKYVSVPTEEDVRKLFKDDETFDEFMAGTDFSYGLADVRDSEFNALCDKVRADMEALVESGKVSAGNLLRLETVPMEFLRNAPLLDGEWLDAHVVELAEWGAILMKRGYSFKSVDDNSPYTWDRIGRAGQDSFVDAEAGVLESARKAAQTNLAKYPGQRREIDGRAYFCFEDYSAWRGRSVKGKLNGNLSHGILSKSWNQWVDNNRQAGAELAGVMVGRIECYTGDYSFNIHPAEEVEQRVRDRNKLLSSLRAHSLHDFDAEKGYFARIPRYGTHSYRDRVLEWKEYVRAYIEELYVLQLCMESVSQRYFDRRPVLFPDMTERLSALVDGWEGLLEWYNDTIGSDFEEHPKRSSVGDTAGLFRLDSQAIKEAARGGLPDRIAYLLDRAKADTHAGAWRPQHGLQYYGKAPWRVVYKIERSKVNRSNKEFFNLPVLGCTLGAGELAERIRDWAEVGQRALLGREAEHGRAILRYRSEPETENELYRLIRLEGECCTFLTFDLATHGRELVLTVAGPNAGVFMATQLS